MDSSMVHSLVLLLLVVESTFGTSPLQKCCPEDDNHVFIQKNGICNSSQTLGLVCSNVSQVVSLIERDNNYWFIERNTSVITGSQYFGMILPQESFCVGNITPLYTSFNNDYYFDGIVVCAEADPSGTYLGPELMGYAICLLVSGIGCFLTFLVYIVVPALRKDLLNKCVTCALFTLTVTFLSIGLGSFQLHRLSRRYCSYQYLFILFWAMSSAFWINVVAFHIWRTIVFKRFPINEDRLLKVYHFWGWGIPLILTLIATYLEGLAMGHDITFAVCHISSTEAFILIMIPYPVLLFTNLLYFVWTIWKLCKQEVPSSSGLELTRFQRLRYKCFLYLKLYLLMGVPWIVYHAAMLLPQTTLTMTLWNTLTILHGVYLFLVLVVFQKKALLGLAEKFAECGCPCPLVTTNVAVTLNEKGDEDNIEAQKDAAVISAEEVKTES